MAYSPIRGVYRYIKLNDTATAMAPTGRNTTIITRPRQPVDSVSEPLECD